jgi:DNA-binding PadR family transcriptional regulator
MNNRTQFAVLGILSLKPQTGYEIKKNIAETVGNFWQESYGQLYPCLQSLLERQLIEIQDISQEKNKKVYQITVQGEAFLLDWLKRPISELPVYRNEFLLKLFFGHHLPVQQSREHLQAYREKIKPILFFLNKLKAEFEKSNFVEDKLRFQYITLLHGLKTFSAELEWVEESLEILSGLNN